MPPQEESDYYPYGGEIPVSGSDSNHYKFTGKERDAETCTTTCVDYFGARHYASSIGRFMTPDLDSDVDDPGPVPYANFRDPQTLNLYSYVRNNPLNRIDPDGHKLVCNNSTTTDHAGTIHVHVNCHEEADSEPIAPSTLDKFRTLFFSDVSDPADKRALINSIVGDVVTGHASVGNTTLNELIPGSPVMSSAPPLPSIPLKVLKVLDAIDTSSSAGPDIEGGKSFQNREGKLPQSMNTGTQSPIKNGM
ncbi:MAG: RHS repeat-associated core domain-containing protein [Terriglobales bacterium]